jgi:PKD repeat protein
VCTFDASASTDDETVDSYAWDFGEVGDGDVATGATPEFTFSGTGSYQVALTVTDNDGSPTTLVKTVAVTAVEPIARVGSTVNSGNVVTPNAPIPATTSAGDRLVMILSLNATNRVQSAPTGTTGWTLIDTAQSGTTTGMVTTVYTKVASATDASGGRVVRVPLDLAAKYTMTVAAYSGDMLAPRFMKASETVARANHTTPTTLVDEDAAAGDWALSYWADRSSTTTAFTLPGGVTQREAACGPTTGRVCSVLADSDGGVQAGPYGGLTATADSAQSAATMWTMLLRQDPATL